MTAPAPPRRRGTRADGLPEHHDYRDDGCSLAPSCLQCPLVMCRYDGYDPRGQARAERARQAQELRAAGLRVEDIASRLGASVRQVYRDCGGQHV